MGKSGTRVLITLEFQKPYVNQLQLKALLAS